MITAPASVSANSRNNDPVSPPWNATGAYTAASVIVMAMIGPTSSRAPSNAAFSGVCPSRMCRSTFSTITMASSTTRPTDNTMARRVRRFSVKPNICMRKTAPMSDTGIATSGIITERSEPRNRKITTATMTSVSANVWTTSFNASSIYLVAS